MTLLAGVFADSCDRRRVMLVVSILPVFMAFETC